MTGGRIRILDTTLRDGDQAAGFALTVTEKVSLARSLADYGVDCLETGFPAASPADAQASRLICEELQGRVQLAVMSRLKPAEIRESAAFLPPGTLLSPMPGGWPPGLAESAGLLHLSCPVSDLHISAKLGIDRASVLRLAVEAVTFASGYAGAVEIGAEDATRSDPAFLAEWCIAVTEAGARVVNIADTVGRSLPGEMDRLVRRLLNLVPAFGSGRAILSVHCHNDRGLALANTLAAVEAGCRQAELTALGVGERAGNAALEEFALVAREREELGIETGIRPELTGDLARAVAASVGSSLSPLKPVTGWNVNAHASGMHQQGQGKAKEAYRLADPAGYGTAPDRIVLSRHSGSAGVASWIREHAGYVPPGETVGDLLAKIKTEAKPPTATAVLRYLSAGIPGGLPTVALASYREETADDHGKPLWRVEARFSDQGRPRPVRAEAHVLIAALLAIVRAETGHTLRVRSASGTSWGETHRVYLETSVEGFGDRLWAFERRGSAPGKLLLECMLDAVNSARAGVASVIASARKEGPG